MDTVVALLRAVARAGRGLFDMVSMAMGVAPANVPFTEALELSDRGEEPVRRGATASEIAVNPSTGYMQLFGPDMPDGHGYAPGEIPEY